MSTQRKYSAERRESAIRMVFETIEPEESLKTVCLRVAPLVDVRFATLYGWAKQARPTTSLPAVGARNSVVSGHAAFCIR